MEITAKKDVTFHLVLKLGFLLSEFYSRKFVNHPCFQASDAVGQIASSFLKARQLKHFSYVRIYDNGSVLCLTTQPDMALDYYQMGFYRSVEYGRKHHFVSSSYLLWASMTEGDNDLATHYREVYQIANGLNILKRREGYSEQFCFAASPENTFVNNDYLANMTEFQNFCYYFTEQARPLLKKLENRRIIMPSDFTPSDKIINSSMDSAALPLFIENPMFKKLYYQGDYLHAMTVREFQCLQWLAKGMSAKMIASQLNLAERTVKSYLDNLKIKLNLNNKMELIQFFYGLY